jgi:mannose-6-phosphate isomerase-like protein (cupin superfamily)
MRIILAAVTILLLLSSPGSTQGIQQTPPDGPESAKLAAQYDPTKATVITAADIAAAISRLPDRPSANGTFVERSDPSSITGLGYRIAVDRRRTPQNANAHRTEGEIWAVIDGTGTITTGGKIVETKKDGKVVSRAIEGGVSQRVTKGDFVVIPEGVPHYITEANPHVIFIAIEFPRPRAAQMPPAPSN